MLQFQQTTKPELILLLIIVLATILSPIHPASDFEASKYIWINPMTMPPSCCDFATLSWQKPISDL